MNLMDLLYAYRVLEMPNRQVLVLEFQVIPIANTKKH